jgi:3-hydroxy-5-methyl-1-naphthoate 3-O-methyltransferase
MDLKIHIARDAPLERRCTASIGSASFAGPSVQDLQRQFVEQSLDQIKTVSLTLDDVDVRALFDVQAKLSALFEERDKLLRQLIPRMLTSAKPSDISYLRSYFEGESPLVFLEPLALSTFRDFDDEFAPGAYSRMYYYFFAQIHAAIIGHATRCGLLYYLFDRARAPSEIARKLGWTERAVEAIMRVLVASEIVVRNDEGYLTKRDIRWICDPTSPAYIGNLLPYLHDAIGVVDGQFGGAKPPPPRPRWQNAPPVDPYEAHELAQAMRAHSFSASVCFARRLSTLASTRFLDVAGGNGSLLCAFARQNANLSGTVLDRQGMGDQVSAFAEALAVRERVDYVAADMFRESFPSGFDTIGFSNIFHDWSPEQCRLLARKAFAALPPGGTLLIQEVLLDEDEHGPLLACLFHARMVMCEPAMNGRQYSFAQLESILDESGFTNITCLSTCPPYSGIVADRRG